MKQIFTIIALLSMSGLFSQNATHACSNLKIQQFNATIANKSAGLISVHNYDEKFVKLELELSSTSKYIAGKCTHLVKVETSSMNEFVLNW